MPGMGEWNKSKFKKEFQYNSKQEVKSKWPPA